MANDYGKWRRWKPGFGRRRRTREEGVRERLLSDWYGADRAHLENETQQPPAANVSDLLKAVIDDLDKDQFLQLRKVVDHWPQIAGPVLCHRAYPRRIQGTILYVEVVDASWLFNLERNFKPELQHIVARLTDQRVTQIRFVPGGKSRQLR